MRGRDELKRNIEPPPPPGGSLSVTVTVAVEFEPRVAPADGLESVTLRVSSPSSAVSSVVWTVMVWLAESPVRPVEGFARARVVRAGRRAARRCREIHAHGTGGWSGTRDVEKERAALEDSDNAAGELERNYRRRRRGRIVIDGMVTVAVRFGPRVAYRPLDWRE